MKGQARLQWKLVAKSVLLGGTTISLILTGLSYLASLITRLVGLPSSLGLPPILSLVGWALSILGFLLAIWLFSYRSPVNMIVSTYFTFVKMFTRSPVSDFGGRNETLVVEGPHRFVRNPLYLGATTIFIGWALITDSTAALLGAVFILAWFELVQIPFEEGELRALFGDQWVNYSERVPMLVPLTKGWRGGKKSPTSEK